jgi:hypothetical protein
MSSPYIINKKEQIYIYPTIIKRMLDEQFEVFAAQRAV